MLEFCLSKFVFLGCALKEKKILFHKNIFGKGEENFKIMI